MQSYRLRAKLPPGQGVPMLSLERIETMNRHAILTAFPLLTAGLVVGLALQFHHGLGQDWDSPKVLSTLIVWVVFALLVYLRYGAHARGRRVALLTMVAFALLIVALIAPGLALRINAAAREVSRGSRSDSRSAGCASGGDTDALPALPQVRRMMLNSGVDVSTATLAETLEPIRLGDAMRGESIEDKDLKELLHPDGYEHLMALLEQMLRSKDVDIPKDRIIDNDFVRRYLTDPQWDYYRGMAYLARKQEHGGERRKGIRNDPTSVEIGNHFGKSERTIRRYAELAEPLTAADDKVPGIREAVLTGKCPKCSRVKRIAQMEEIANCTTQQGAQQLWQRIIAGRPDKDQGPKRNRSPKIKDDGDLQRVKEAWPTLPAEVRQAIMALVDGR